MNQVLKNRIAPKVKTTEGQKQWSYKAPSYDNRSSCSVSAGDDYGTGFANPIGLEKASGIGQGPIPMKAMAFSSEGVVRREDIAG